MANFGLHQAFSDSFFRGNTAGCGADETTGQNPPIDVDLDDPGPDGWQLETGLIEVLPGEEVQNCYFFEVPFRSGSLREPHHARAKRRIAPHERLPDEDDQGARRRAGSDRRGRRMLEQPELVGLADHRELAEQRRSGLEVARRRGAEVRAA